MSYDAHANLAYATVAVAPSPAASGTSLTVSSGKGALFPTAPFNCTVYPAGSSPLASNAEIVRVTNVVGDVFTIVRAQEGTTAKSIATGWQIANTATKLVFTNIENSIIQFISAGSTKAGASEVVFSNSNGVSFGVSGQTITASVNTAGGGTGGAAISAGTQSGNTGTIVFANSNGLTFGMSDSSQITASHNGLTSQSAQVASASNGSFTFQTLNFSDGGNVHMGTTAGGAIYASLVAAPAAGSLSAGTTSVQLGQGVFSNSNGITFGLNGSTITASHDGLTSQSNQAASASNGSFTFQTLGFADANGVTFGTSAGSIITASVNAGGGGSITFSAGTSSAALNSLVFANSNGVSFGLNGSTITASANGGTGGGGGATISYFEPVPFANNGTVFQDFQNSQPYIDPVNPQCAVTFNNVRFLASCNGVATSAAANASGSAFMSASLAIFSRSVTDRAATNFSNSSIWVTHATATQATHAFFSASSNSVTAIYTLSTDSTGGTIQLSTTSNNSFIIPFVIGQKVWNFNLAASLTAGEYLLWHNFVSTISGNANATRLLQMSRVFFTMMSNVSWGPDFGVASTPKGAFVIPNLGYYSTNNVSSQLTSLALTDVANQLVRRYIVFNCT